MSRMRIIRADILKEKEGSPSRIEIIYDNIVTIEYWNDGVIVFSDKIVETLKYTDWKITIVDI